MVPKAAITLTNDATNVSQQTLADANGSFRFSLVPPGTYTLVVKVPGFNERQVKSVLVEASKTTPVDVVLTVSGTATTVEVTAQDQLVQTASSEVANNVNTRSIENMPLLTRNAFDLAFMAPQVSPGMDGNPSAGGLRQASTSYLLNGAENNYNFSSGAYNISPPLKSVGEFTIVTNSMSAQYGRDALFPCLQNVCRSHSRRIRLHHIGQRLIAFYLIRNLSKP